jgi:hypothetical protein
MQSTTLAVALIVSTLVLLLRLPYALSAYIAALVWYPDFLRISIGTIDISVGRIVVTALLLRCLCDIRIRRRFVWSRLDTWVTLSMAVYVGIYCITYPLSEVVENRAGFLMDTWLAYMAVRLVVTDKATLISFTKATSVPLAALAVLGVVECVTHWQPFLSLARFCPWQTPVGEIIVEGRWGLTRAMGPFSHSIMFGICFVLFLPLIWSLRHEQGYWGKLAYPLSAAVVIGAFSSMSSGPWTMLIITIFCLAMEKYKRWVKPLLLTLVISCMLVGVISNRPFYYVLYSYLNPVGGDWWNRAKIIDCAIEDFGKWCWLGYGGQDPGWGEKTGMGHTDPTNEFIFAGVEYGMLGVVALCSVLFIAIRKLVRLHKLSNDAVLKSWIWASGTVLIATIAVFMSVSLFGQIKTLFYCILGISGSLHNLLMGQTALKRTITPSNSYAQE